MTRRSMLAALFAPLFAKFLPKPLASYFTAETPHLSKVIASTGWSTSPPLKPGDRITFAGRYYVVDEQADEVMKLLEVIYP